MLEHPQLAHPVNAAAQFVPTEPERPEGFQGAQRLGNPTRQIVRRHVEIAQPFQFTKFGRDGARKSIALQVQRGHRASNGGSDSGPAVQRLAAQPIRVVVPVMAVRRVKESGKHSLFRVIGDENRCLSRGLAGLRRDCCTPRFHACHNTIRVHCCHAGVGARPGDLCVWNLVSMGVKSPCAQLHRASGTRQHGRRGSDRNGGRHRPRRPVSFGRDLIACARRDRGQQQQPFEE